ncbi:hypothetical protein [Endozoicomonas sp. ONNA2]|uniref:hypothetical protein n=1 Tax=Endozoicomonas sp. ONNA2 TaxID=2828741 RepID=UPI002148D8E1|nr:hypothetical protein [Endozoicomonas sp. ONNA2]
MEEIKEEGGEGRFNQVSTTVTSGIDNPVLKEPVENVCDEPYPPQDFKPLVDFSVSLNQSPATQVRPAIATSPKHTDPAGWDWDQWQHDHYKVTETGAGFYTQRSKEEFLQLKYKLLYKLECEDLFDKCKKILTSPVQQIGMTAFQNCECFLDLSEQYHNNEKPLTPFILECYEKGLFTREFMNELYNT